VALQPIQFIKKRLITTSLLVCGGDLFDHRHQRFGDESSAVDTEVAACVRIVNCGFGDGRAGTRQLRPGEVGHQ
jgi:hypothetical protein